MLLSQEKLSESELESVSVLYQVKNLTQHFSQGRYSKETVHALNGISLTVYKGETLGLVGETGCGKSTLCRALMRLYKPTAGVIKFQEKDITNLSERHLKEVRQNVQMIFQDPADSMNSRMNVGAIIEEPLAIQKKLSRQQRKERALELLKDVGLPNEAYLRYPHEFSGGQRQRIAIARALALQPKVLVCDEPVSALDVSVQSQVLNLLLDLQEKHKLTLIFVSHGLNVVRHMSDRVAVLYLGIIVELASSQEIYQNPLHPYTQALISAIPKPNPDKKLERTLFRGEIPSPIYLPSGCAFHQNCPKAIEKCYQKKPEYREIYSKHFCACHLF